MKKANSNLEGYIKNILGNLELEIDFDGKISGLDSISNNSTEIETLFLSEYQVIDDNNNLNLFVLVSDWKTQKPTSDEIQKAVVEELKQITSVPITKVIVHILYRVKNIETKINRENIIMPVKKETGKRSVPMTAQIKKECKGHLNIKSVKIKFICDTILESEKIELNEIKRFTMLSMPEVSYFFKEEETKQKEENTVNYKGYVLTIPLVQLVKIYNNVGDALFKNNVRYGIEDALGVDEAIRSTLCENPGTFWFKNNGVTIVINDDKFSLDKSSKITLYNSRAAKDELKFSVVNGAQTITASADYYYELACSNNEEDKKRLKDYESNAKVLLRLIHVKESKKELSDSNVDAISVALNRQKPIFAEDIAFSAPQITDLQRISHKTKLNLIKRGQKTGENGVSLDELARYRKAITLKPGSARNNVSSKLLKLDADRKLSQDLFPDWSSLNLDNDTEITQENKMLQAYYKSYKWVPFVQGAISQSNSYINKLKNKVTSLENQDVNTIVMNGKWYLICSILDYLFTNSELTKEEAFTDNQWKELQKIYSKAKWPGFMEEYAVKLNNVINDKDFVAGVEAKDFSTIINSNMFKNDTLFEEIKKQPTNPMVKELNKLISKKCEALMNNETAGDEKLVQVIRGEIPAEKEEPKVEETV